MSYLDRLKETISETHPPRSPPKPAKAGFGGSAGASPTPVSETLAPSSVVRTWRAALDGLDRETPLHGLDAQRWRELLRDARWLLDHFVQQAARDGWSAADLFGLLPGHDGWGGVADRLQGSRSLVMTADRASWRRMLTGTPDGFARGGSAMLRLVVLWELEGS
jgi:hypothetical protein